MNYYIAQGGDLSANLSRRTKTMQEAVQEASPAELAAPKFVANLNAQIPQPVVLLVDEVERELFDADMTLSTIDGPRMVHGEQVRVTVPATGSVSLLSLRPTESSLRQFPCCIKKGYTRLGLPARDCLVWTYQEPRVEPEHFNAWWIRELEAVQRQIGYLNRDIERFAAGWAAQVETAITARKARLEDQQRRRQALGA